MSQAVESAKRVLLGELLVQAKVITPEQLGEVLSSPREPGKKLGQALLERGWVTEAQLTQTLSLQLSVPWVSLYHIDFSRQLLNRVSRDLAEKYCLIPIFVRHVKGQGETLYVAMDDPTNEGALVEVGKLAALPTRPMIASASDIKSAIRVYYGESPSQPHLEVPMMPPQTSREGRGAMQAAAAADAQPAAKPATKPSKPPPPPAAARRPRPSDPGADVAPPTTRSNPPEAATAAAAAAPAAEPEPAKRRGRMVSLTFLDGTTLQLPSAKKKKEVFASEDGLTARDFISALRATAHGADATEVLGDQVKWEPVVAALLSILLRKGLIADWEFVEELRKI